MRNPLPALDALTAAQMGESGPAPDHHEVCTLTLAWARHQGMPDGVLYDLAEDIRSTTIAFFDWSRYPVDVVDGRLVRYGDERPRDPVRRDAQWNEGRMAMRMPVMPGVMLSHGSVRIDTSMPLSLLASLPGRPLDDLITLPFPVDAVIATARMGEGLEVEVEPRWTAVTPD